MQRETYDSDDVLDFALGDDGAHSLDDGQSSGSAEKTDEGAGPEPTTSVEPANDGQLELFDHREHRTEPSNQRQQPTSEGPAEPANSEQQDKENLTPLGQSGFFTNASGDVLDQSGQVIAKAGAERRLFERSENIQQQLRHKDSYIGALESEINQLKEARPPKSNIDKAVEQLGFNEQEVTLGLQMTNMWKRDPLSAVAHMFAEARKLGYDDQRIGQAIQSYNPANNPANIETAVNRAIQPILQRVEQQSQPQPDPQVEVRNEIQRVFAKYDGAYLHQDALGRMIQDHRAKTGQNLSLEQAVIGLRQFVQQHGLDFMQPLGPQIEARRRQTQPRPPVNTPDAPGRVATRPDAVGDVNATKFAEPDDDWGAIVRSAMGPRS